MFHGGNTVRAPLTVYMELTRDCNLSCNHCLVRKEKRDMPLECALSLLDQLVEEQVFKVYFTGGEPLLYPGLLDLLEHINGKPIWSLVQTNGLLVTDDLAESFSEAGLGACDLPLFGITPKIHDAVTGNRGSFERLFSAIEILTAHGVRTFVTFTVLRPNVHELPQFFDWALEQGIPLAHVRRFIPRYPQDEMLPDMKTLAPILSHYAARRDEYDEKGLHFEIEEAFDFSEISDSRCPAGIQLCHITAEGTITPCPYISLSGESVLENKFKQIWETSSLLQKIRTPLEMKGKCVQCTFQEQCGGGCAAAAYHLNGTFESPDPYCLIHPDPL
jgi:radical SAM protein with 4Fe4S-binding SPASM domain